jgi:hypothetical protein
MAEDTYDPPIESEFFNEFIDPALLNLSPVAIAFTPAKWLVSQSATTTAFHPFGNALIESYDDKSQEINALVNELGVPENEIVQSSYVEPALSVSTYHMDPHRPLVEATSEGSFETHLIGDLRGKCTPL